MIAHLGAFHSLLHSSADVPLISVLTVQYKPNRILVPCSQRNTRMQLMRRLFRAKEQHSLGKAAGRTCKIHILGRYQSAMSPHAHRSSMHDTEGRELHVEASREPPPTSPCSVACHSPPQSGIRKQRYSPLVPTVSTMRTAILSLVRSSGRAGMSLRASRSRW